MQSYHISVFDFNRLLFVDGFLFGHDDFEGIIDALECLVLVGLHAILDAINEILELVVPSSRQFLVIQFGRLDFAVRPVDRIVGRRQTERGFFAVNLERHLEGCGGRGSPTAFGRDQCAIVIVLDGDDMVDAALGDETIYTVGSHGLRIAEHAGDEIRVMQVHIQKGATREFTVAEPILPVTVIDAR